MRRPPFRVDGRTGQMRWEGIDGRKHVKSGRLKFLAMNWAEGVISGTGRAYEMRLSEGHPWHVIEATPDEMREACLSVEYGYGRTHSRAMVARCERVRVARVMRGLMVFP